MGFIREFRSIGVECPNFASFSRRTRHQTLVLDSSSLIQCSRNGPRHQFRDTMFALGLLLGDCGSDNRLYFCLYGNLQHLFFRNDQKTWRL